MEINPTLDDENVMALIRALGFDPAQTGDFTLTADFKIAGVARVDITASIFATHAD